MVFLFVLRGVKGIGRAMAGLISSHWGAPRWLGSCILPHFIQLPAHRKLDSLDNIRPFTYSQSHAHPGIGNDRNAPPPFIPCYAIANDAERLIIHGWATLLMNCFK